MNTVTTYHEPEHPNWQPGAEPGIDTSANQNQVPLHLVNLKAACDITIVDFSDTDVKIREANNTTLAARLAEPRTEELPCRWISVNGLSGDVITLLSNNFKFHRLANEDLVHTNTRTKVDWYADHAFIVLTLQKLVKLHEHKGQNGQCDCASMDDDDMNEKLEHHHSGRSSWWNFARPRKQNNVLPRYLDRNTDGKIDEFIPAHSSVDEGSPIKPIRTLHRYESAQIPEHTAWMEKHSVLAGEGVTVSVEQVSVFLMADNCVISFFEQSAQDVEAPILKRLQNNETILKRSCDASLLTQAIIDTIVDLAVPVREAYNKARKELQIDAMTNPNIKTSRALHIFGEEIDMLQNLFKPIVQLVNSLRDHNSEPPPSSATSVAVAPPFPPTAPASNPKPPTMSDKSTSDRPGQAAANLLRRQSDFRKIALQRADAATTVMITPLAHIYFGDVLDHCITMISTLEQMDASADNISTLIFNTVGAKTNNFMMILAVVTVFFAPLTFVSGYFGMNFANGSGLNHPFGYFWFIAIPSLVLFMVIVFATMLWDNIRSFLARRGLRAWHRRRGPRR